MKTDRLDDIYTLHIMALVSKTLTKIHQEYPDMLPEELLLIAVAGLLQEEEDHPMGSSRQELLELSMDYLKNAYGNESILLDVRWWRNLEKLSTVLRDLSEK
jgi:hypothetical protein